MRLSSVQGCSKFQIAFTLGVLCISAIGVEAQRGEPSRGPEKEETSESFVLFSPSVFLHFPTKSSNSIPAVQRLVLWAGVCKLAHL